MNLIAERKWTTLLFNPFVYIAGAPALGYGVAVIVVAGLLGFTSHTHFDGVLDMHSGSPAPFAFFMAEGFIDWLCLALVLLALGKLISKTAFRIIDVLGTQALARWPTILMVLITLPPAFQRYNHVLLEQVKQNPLQLPPLTPDAVYFFASAFLMLPLLVWMIVLMYNAYSVSCNVGGAKAVLTFITGLLLAEILSKLAIYALR
jgi:hypothetical protein